jgi:hypothetical protein
MLSKLCWSSNFNLLVTSTARGDPLAAATETPHLWSQARTLFLHLQERTYKLSKSLVRVVRVNFLGLMNIHHSLDEVVEFDLVGSGAFLDIPASELLLNVAHELVVGDPVLDCVSI